MVKEGKGNDFKGMTEKTGRWSSSMKRKKKRLPHRA